MANSVLSNAEFGGEAYTAGVLNIDRGLTVLANGELCAISEKELAKCKTHGQWYKLLMLVSSKVGISC